VARFFHALVVAGAAIASTACGGQSKLTVNDEGGSGGTGGGAGKGGTSGNGAGPNVGSGGGSEPGGATSTATGGASSGGGSATVTGGTSAGGSSATVTGGSSATVTGGTGTMGGTAGAAGKPVGPLPEPGPTAQWDCRQLTHDCTDVLGTTASVLMTDCPIDPTLPKSQADCESGELFTCNLAVTAGGSPVLVNCDCIEDAPGTCAGCYSLAWTTYGLPVSCSDSLKVCACAYTGILK
jgi:hypothetical protein